MEASDAGSWLTPKHAALVVGLPVWGFLWFWPMLGQGGVAYSGIDYVVRGERAMADFFYVGTGVGLAVAYGLFTELPRVTGSEERR
jgi:hypothetical protein